MIATSAAVTATLAQALRVVVGSWGHDLQRAARSPEHALERIGHRLERFKAIGLNSENGLLVSACGLVDANPVLVAQRLHTALYASVADALVTGPHREAPARVHRAVEQAWPRVLDHLSRELWDECARRTRVSLRPHPSGEAK